MLPGAKSKKSSNIELVLKRDTSFFFLPLLDLGDLFTQIGCSSGPVVQLCLELERSKVQLSEMEWIRIN